MADTVQHKIGRNRPPRVQITYDVEIGNAIEKQEIPFVVGIMADLSGFGDAVPGDRVGLKDRSRSFVEIDRDNFADVMGKIAPSLDSPGALDANGRDAGGRLVFRSIDDFKPDTLVKRIGEIEKLQRQRSALRDVLTKLDSNDDLYDDLKRRIAGGTLGAVGDAAASRLETLEALSEGGGPSEKPPEVKPEVKAAGKPAEKPVTDAPSGGEIAGGDRPK